MTTKDIEND